MTTSELTAETLGDDSTIVALATPVGRGAIAVVRMSGPRATAIARKVVLPMPSSPRELQRCVAHDHRGEPLDDALVWFFSAPHSYTGEDLVEISTHGGAVVPVSVVRALVDAGARLAEPGEFTRRAVLNGKMDLLQAEAVGDLVDARSTAAQRQSLRQLDGGLSQELERLRQRILEIEALLAYDIDFPEEDDGPIPRARIADAAESVRESLAKLLATSGRGEVIRDGALIVLAGAPNSGKSSLFNALLGEARAIVTDIAGTTRDAIEATLDLPLYPLRLVDTAGLRDTGDPIELLGIETTGRYLKQAAVVLACVSPATEHTTVATITQHTDAPVVIVGMKSDLGTERYEKTPTVQVSALERTGLAELIAEIERVLEARYGGNTEGALLLTRARHRALVSEAAGELDAFVAGWHSEQLPAPILATHVHHAANALGEMIGAVHVDDVLDVVFRSFCVGK